MVRKNSRSTTVHAFTDKGVYIGTWQSISDAARACNTTQPSISNALMNEDHFSVGRYWVTNKEDIYHSMLLHQMKVEEEKKRLIEAKEKRQIERPEPTERHGDYIFVKSDMSGDECCRKCALYDANCLPCRPHENHANGYWKYKKQN